LTKLTSPVTTLLSARSLRKTYPRAGEPVRALDDVSLEVAAGEMVIVRGPSGSGKSTLLLTCGALLAPDDGELHVADQTPYALSADGRAAFRAQHLGFVFQQFHLVPYLSVLDNVLAAALAANTPDAADRAAALLEKFGLGDRTAHLPGELSTGERQRTALARAMLNEPKLILADEPTGNLDEANAREVLRSLEIFTENGGAVLLVTHDSSILQYAHRAIRLVAGKIVEN
jgi:ABC-type lipoprotein export system ATPase subunit